MKISLCLSVFGTLVASLISVSSLGAAGVPVGGSSRIGALDYSDTFTGSWAGGVNPFRPFIPAVQPVAAYVVENAYGHPAINFDIGSGFTFAADSGLGGLLDGNPSYPFGLAPNASGAGSATGFTQCGGSIDYAIPYNGFRSSYVVQVDAIQVADRIDISSGVSPGIYGIASLSVFFRGDGSGNASLFNGATDTPIQSIIPTFNTGITGSGQWNNYAVRFDTAAHEIELFVNQNSVGVINLTTFAGGIYANFGNQWIGAGAGLAAGENRVWTDNFQVGAPIIIPHLQIDPLAGAARLKWSTNATDYLLETNSVLTSSAGWGVLTSNYSIVDTNFVVTNAVSGAARFYRLHKP